MFFSPIEWEEKGVSGKVLDTSVDEFQVSYDALMWEPVAHFGLETILVSLEERSEAHIAWAEKVP